MHGINLGRPLNSSLQTAALIRLAVAAEVCADDVVSEAADDKISKNAGILCRR